MSDEGRPAVLEWSDRDRGVPAASPAKLAALVDSALDRSAQVLFTVTPREELGTFARFQRLADQAWCGQLRAVVASTARMSGTDRDFAGDELALALNISSLTGRNMVWEFGAIAALPGLVEAVEQGRVTVRHVQAVMRVLEESGLTLEQRQAVALIAVSRFTGQTPGEWADLVRRLTLTIDPAAAARRRDEKAAGRQVRFYPQADEQGAMWLQAPAVDLARAQARLTAEAARLKAAGDDRMTDQLVCDLALALLADGRLDGQEPAAFEVHVIVPIALLEEATDGDASPATDGPAGADTGQAHESDGSDVTADADACESEGSDEAGQGDEADGGDGSDLAMADAADHDLDLAEIPGWGVVLPDTARRLAAQAASFTQIAVDDDGAVTAVGDRIRADRVTDARTAPLPPPSDRFLHHAVQAMRQAPDARDLTSRLYRPGTRLGRRLRARDRTCVFPGCRQLASRTDADHRIPWPRGSTSLDNLQCLCRHHHRAKHAIFTVQAEADGTIIWITRGGWRFRRPPKHYRRPQGD